jgi:hypothetical protein
MAEHERGRDLRSFRDEAERGGRALGGTPRPEAEPSGFRRQTGATGYGVYEDDRGGFVEDYRGGPGSGGYSRDKRDHRGSGYGALGFNEPEIAEGPHRGRGPRGYQRSDGRIQEDVCDRLTDDPFIDASDVLVSVTDGELTLAGHVFRREDKRRAEYLAETVAGVRHVQNNLRVRATAQRGLDAVSATGAGGGSTGSLGPAGGTGLSGTGAREGTGIAGTEIGTEGGARAGPRRSAARRGS